MQRLASKVILYTILALTLGLLLACKSKPHDDHHEHHAEDAATEADLHGPHGGKLLQDQDFKIELLIFENGMKPRFAAYAYDHEQLLATDAYQLKIVLQRLGGETDTVTFAPKKEYLLSDQEIKEPHSFKVLVTASFNGKDFHWNYDSIEGRVEIDSEVAKAAGIKTESASSQGITKSVKVHGKIAPSEHKIAHIIPRFSGLVREGRKHIGDRVEKGEVLALIESNQSLEPFEVKSQISGTVVSGHLIVGEFVPENQWVYVVADLSEVWVDFYVPFSDRSGIAVGQVVKIWSLDQEHIAQGKVSYVAPYADEKSQSQLVRVIVPNKEQVLLAGMFVTGEIVLAEKQVPLAVKNTALQKFRDWNVVFAKHNQSYEVRPLELGLSDGVYTEVLSGLAQNEEYVTENSFLIKADILKSGAAHDH